MFLVYSVVSAVGGMAISLGVGASTFALIFYFLGIHSPSLREGGRTYQKVVYIVLRVAMVLILLTEIIKGILYIRASGMMTFEGLFIANAPVAFMWTVIVVLFLNAILMTLHLMSMKLGPAIQATSWYTLGTMAALPLVTFSYLPLILTYLGCILAFAVIIELITQKVTPRPEAISDTMQT